MVYPIRSDVLSKREGFQKMVTIPSASVLTLNSVPYVLLTAPTLSIYAICVTELFARITTGTAYASLHDMTVLYGSSGATICTLPGTGFLDQTAATGVFASFIGTSSKGTIVVPNAAVNIVMGTSDPTTGTSPLTIKIRYKIHKVS